MLDHIPLHVTKDDAPALWVVGDVVRIVLSGAQTNGTFALVDTFVSPGKGTPPHVHSREDETFIITEGEVEFWVDGKTIAVPAGGVLHAPKGIPHRYGNSTSVMARMYVVCTPAGMDQFFQDIGDPCHDSQAQAPVFDMQRLIQGCQKHGITLLT